MEDETVVETARDRAGTDVPDPPVERRREAAPSPPNTDGSVVEGEPDGEGEDRQRDGETAEGEEGDRDRDVVVEEGAHDDGRRPAPDPAGRSRPPEAAEEPRRRRLLEISRPGDGSPVGEVAVASHREVLEAVERARKAQKAWIDLEAEERFRRLGGLLEEIGGRTDEIVEVITDETGKPAVEALAEVLLTVDLLKYYAEVAPRILRRQWVKANWLIGKSAYTYREPFGVVGAITPWNYPFLLVMDAVTAALFTGNTVVVKPSELTPFSALKVKELCVDAGLPEDLVEIVAGDGETGETLVRAGCDKILFTGSSRTGRKVMATAAESLTPVALELGGKDPAIVLDDADLDRAARGVVYGAFFNAGQTCLSTERAFVAAEIYDEFVERVTELAGELRVGTGGEYDVGPMIDARRLRVVEEQVEDALARGARVTVGGSRPEEGSPCYLPTVIVDVDQTMKVLWEETFGPILPVMRVEDDEEAVHMANVSPFGLFASIWTEDRDRGERLGEQLRCGGVSINDTLSHYAVPGLSVGGTGESGFGRRRGVAGLEELTRQRSVLVHRTGLTREIWWYPYSEKAYRLVRALLEYRQSTGLKRVWNGIRHLFRRRRSS